MKSTIGWILAIVFGLVLLFFMPSVWMMGRYWMGGYGGMMGGFNSMHPFGWGGMLLGWLVPVGGILLLVIGGVALVNSLNRSGNTSQPPVVLGRTCPNCGKPAQGNLSTCPYCFRW